MSATIYDFPAKGRYAHQDPSEDSKLTNTPVSRIAKIAFGNAWYHEEAVQAERGDKEPKPSADSVVPFRPN
jgi:hypothetical protein